MGYRHEKDKLRIGNFTTEPSQSVRAVRIAECPIQLEAVLETVRPFGTRPDKDPGALAFEVRIVRAHVHTGLLVEGVEDRIDSDKWRPLMMSFCRFYGLGPEIFDSTLAEIPESSYRPVAHMMRHQRSTYLGGQRTLGQLLGSLHGRVLQAHGVKLPEEDARCPQRSG